MINILIHGLGQNSQSWDKTAIYLRKNGIDTICPDLFEITDNDLTDYKEMYEAFSGFCNNQDGKVNLCGLSLGGILAMDFAKSYPKKVNSVILIGTPYRIPKTLFKLQSLIFKIMPKKNFKKTGCSKKAFITLVSSMKNIDISSNLYKIECSSLILCGAKDNINIENAKLLNKNIRSSKFKIIENAGHEVNIDNPKALAKIIYSFWKNKQ